MAYSVAALKPVKPRYAVLIMLTHCRFFLLIALLATVLATVLAACGQRGPLYLPDESAPLVVPAQTSQPPAVQPAVRPNPLDGGFEDENKTDQEELEDEPADGL